jgi:hypothetical protein
MCSTQHMEVYLDDIYYAHFGKHHCSILVYQSPLVCVLALIKQHLIITSIYKLGPLSLSRRLAASR